MCAKIENVPQKHRGRTVFPAGVVVSSLTELNARFAEVTPHERGVISRKVMAALPENQRLKMRSFAAGKTNATPVSDGYVELFVFLAIAAIVKEVQQIYEVVRTIVERKCGAGYIVAAA